MIFQLIDIVISLRGTVDDFCPDQLFSEENRTTIHASSAPSNAMFRRPGTVKERVAFAMLRTQDRISSGIRGHCWLLDVQRGEQTNFLIFGYVPP